MPSSPRFNKSGLILEECMTFKMLEYFACISNANVKK
jgi:hypothetical protein